jgi:hypothetical protein
MTTNIKRVIAYHISRLKDKNPETRLKSIQELAQLPDDESLAALQAAYQSETDPVIKKAAQEAGRLIFSQLNGAQR